MCFKCSGQRKDFLFPIEEDLPKKEKKQRLSGFDWHFRITTHTPVLLKPSCTVCIFRWAGERRGGGACACTCDQTAFCDQPWATAQLIYDVSSSRGKQQHGLVRKPPYPHFSPPLGTDLAFPSSLITSFSDLHLLFQSWFPGPFFISPAISSFHKSCWCF